ncbi:MAG: hypothetical protein GY870_02540 [archaeon]|nr:hypothetical protein [archaeon]
MKIIREEDYIKAQEEYSHLFEIGILKKEMIENNIDWMIRDGYNNAGTLMLGDLYLKKFETNELEIHPFPEWVILMHQPMKKSGKAYVIVPNVSEKDISRLIKREWGKRIEKIQKMLDGLTSENYIAVEYVEGISIKIPENVPHDFISVVKEGEVIPYLQVFEPNWEGIGKALKITTPYFTIKNSLKIQ